MTKTKPTNTHMSAQIHPHSNLTFGLQAQTNNQTTLFTFTKEAFLKCFLIWTPQMFVTGAIQTCIRVTPRDILRHDFGIIIV